MNAGGTSPGVSIGGINSNAWWNAAFRMNASTTTGLYCPNLSTRKPIFKPHAIIAVFYISKDRNSTSIAVTIFHPTFCFNWDMMFQAASCVLSFSEHVVLHQIAAIFRNCAILREQHARTLSNYCRENRLCNRHVFRSEQVACLGFFIRIFRLLASIFLQKLVHN
jgi:hypothetical protein